MKNVKIELTKEQEELIDTHSNRICDDNSEYSFMPLWFEKREGHEYFYLHSLGSLPDKLIKLVKSFRFDNDTLREEKELDFDDVYLNKMGMCACGRPNEVKKLMYDLLKNHQDELEGVIDFKEREKRKKEIIKEVDPDIVFEIIFHIFENADLMEHGGSVYNAWFNEKGKDFFELLKKEVEV